MEKNSGQAEMCSPKALSLLSCGKFKKIFINAWGVVF